jgi:hypothetical protein
MLTAMSARVHTISSADAFGLADAIERARPVVIRGGALAWPATQRWSADSLRARIGNVPIRVKRSRTNAHPDFRAAALADMFATEAMTVAELLDRIASSAPEQRARWLFTGDEKFLLRRRSGATTIDADLAILLDDIVVPSWIEPALYTAWAWISGAGVRTWLHYDNNGCHNLNSQLTGRKTCVLYAPEHLAALAPFPLGGSNPAHNCSQLDVDDPNVEARLATLPRLEAALEAGDQLFIPAWWFHTFAHHGELNTNINLWWRPTTPLGNAVAARQQLLEWAAATGVDPRGDDPTAALLRRLDQLATTGTATAS